MGFLRVRKPFVGERMRGVHGIDIAADRVEWTGDFYFQRLTKLVPGEGALLFTIGAGQIPADALIVKGLWTLVCALAVAVFRYRYTADRGERPQWGGIVISIVSLVLWVLMQDQALGPFVVPYDQAYILFLLGAAWVTLVPAAYTGDPD
jgi:hypothetical protein